MSNKINLEPLDVEIKRTVQVTVRLEEIEGVHDADVLRITAEKLLEHAQKLYSQG